jgi:2-keto-4-pentenoate hydratase/2-oxohepta-3-ene-1,7-dioic acid hydratase in catechol pathway
MRIARYKIGSDTRLGLVSGNGLIDLTSRLDDSPSDSVDLMARWPDIQGQLANLAEEASDHELDAVKLLAPVKRPGKILGIGMNYADHAREIGQDLPTAQLWFSKESSSINGPCDHVEMPVDSTHLDYEAEMVCVIGRKIRHADSEEAAKAIFGYCVGNDVSVRDRQFHTSQFLLGKCGDTHAPVGPWITTADDVDVSDLEIMSLVNGEIRQRSRTSELVYNCVQMVEHLSRVLTLQPGDLLFTGTPAGVGMASNPPRWLIPGDIVRVEISGLGAIENRVADPAF